MDWRRDWRGAVPTRSTSATFADTKRNTLRIGRSFRSEYFSDLYFVPTQTQSKNDFERIKMDAGCEM